MPESRSPVSPWPFIAIAVVAVTAYLALSTNFEDGDPRPMGTVEDIGSIAARDDVNLLFILVDTLRADRLGAYGYERDTSPLFDHLAKHGLRFDRHLAQSSWTKASMASLWTSLYPTRAGVTRFNDLLSGEAVMPAERLRDAGFLTAGIWRNGWVSGYFGFDQGFEVYHRPVPEATAGRVERQNPTLSIAGTDVAAVESAEDFVRVHQNERWFLYMHLMDVHEYTYDEDSAKFGTSYSDIYDNSILRTNIVLDRLYRFLADSGQLDNTLIVMTSDHGEAFGERGFEGHARKVYRETTEVPWIMSFPFKLEEGLVVEARTRNVDTWPTVLDLLGYPIDSFEDLDGFSRMPEILAAAQGLPTGGENEADPGLTIAHLDQTWGQSEREPRPTVAVLEGPLRYVQSSEPDGEMIEQLFDRSTDEAELVDLFAKRPEEAARLRDQAEGYLASEPPWGADTRKLELNEIQLNQLRALGYQLP